MSATDTRRPAVAGLFYPSDPDTLSETVDRLLLATEVADAAQAIRMLLVPHAGYPYSGAIAAAAFGALRDRDIRTCIVIGPSHVEAFDHASIFAGTAYQTPLGMVHVDADLAHAIARESPDHVRISARGHIQRHLDRGEHGIEVELPFIQKVLPDARIVPIVMGRQAAEDAAALGNAIERVFTDDMLIVASSDLSHFYNDAIARQLDTAFLDALGTADAAAVTECVASGRGEACGAGAVVSGLIALGDTPRRFTLLQSGNSGDVTGDRSSVVGYASGLVTMEAQ